MVGIKRGPDAEVVVHVGDGALDVVLDGLDGGIGGAEPELLVGVQAEVLRDLEDVVQTSRQALAVPAADGEIPPHGPFPARQPVHGLKTHERAKTLHVIHRKIFGHSLNGCVTFQSISRPGRNIRLLGYQGTGGPPPGGFGSLRTTTMVNLATSAEMAPMAARSGARTAPTAAGGTGILTNVLPCSSFTTMRCTLPSWIRSRTLSTRSRPRT